MSIHYESGLYRLGQQAKAQKIALSVVDRRTSDVVGNLLTNRGWKIGTLTVSTFINESYQEALKHDLSKMGFIISPDARQKVVVGLEALTTTFVYESFRPFSLASAELSLSLYFDDELLFTEKYIGNAKNTYYITGKKVAAQNAMDAVQSALRSAFSDSQFLQTIVK